MNILNRVIASESVEHFMFISAFDGEKLRKFVPQVDVNTQHPNTFLIF